MRNPYGSDGEGDLDLRVDELLSGDREPRTFSDHRIVQRHRGQPVRVQRSIRGQHLMITVDGRSFVRPSRKHRFASATIASDTRLQVIYTGDDLADVIDRTTSFCGTGTRPTPFVVVDLDTFELAHEVAA